MAEKGEDLRLKFIIILKSSRDMLILGINIAVAKMYSEFIQE